MPAHRSPSGSTSSNRASSQNPPDVIRLGTRGSALALAQADLVVATFARLHPEIAAKSTVIRTDGDVDKSSPLTVIGGRGVFTTALEEAIRRGIVDAAVHSAKDLPSDCPPDLQIIAFFNRQDPRDVLVSRHGRSLMELPDRPVIGTSSRRRAVQVLAKRPDAQIVELRGNVDTRLRKADETDLDGIVLAAAGVTRMGWQDRIVEYLPLDRFIPSPGQGALAIQTRVEPGAPVQFLADLDEPEVSLPVRVERAFLRGIGAGCSTPVGAYAEWSGDALILRCMLAREDGNHATWATELLGPEGAEAHAAELAQRMLSEVGSQRPPVSSSVAGRSLAGLSVLVTRPGTSGTSFEADLVAVGASPVSAPTIRIAPPGNTAPVDRAVAEIGSGTYDWVVFTSGNAVDGVLRRIDAAGLSPVILEATRVAAVGSATSAKLARAGIEVDLVPDRFDGEAVRDALVAEGVSGKRILLPRGNLAREVIAAGLREAGAIVDQVEVYRTEAETSLDPAIVEAIECGVFDVVTFASSSCVRALSALLPNGLKSLLMSAVACLGPVTAETARDYGLRVDIVAEDATIPGLVQALIDKRDRIDAIRGQRSARLIGAQGGQVR
jgi:hydroxymethylbilane synthase